MAKRGLAIGRIIEHLRTCDIEELEYLGHRAAQIHSERTPVVVASRGPKKSHKRKQSLTEPSDLAQAAQVERDRALPRFDTVR
jgi:hypothetical protein